MSQVKRTRLARLLDLTEIVPTEDIAAAKRSPILGIAKACVPYASHSRSQSRIWFRRVVHVPNPHMQIFAIRLLSGQTLFELPSMTSSPIPGRRRFMLTCLSLSCAVPLTASAAIPHLAADSTRRRVFAHYMVAWPRGGPQATVASYPAEFRDAHTRGIDGFALNCGGWDASSVSDFLARFGMKHEKIKFVQLSELSLVPLHRHRPQDRLSAATVIGRLAERRSPGALRGRAGRSPESFHPHPSVRGTRLYAPSSCHPAGDPGA